MMIMMRIMMTGNSRQQTKEHSINQSIKKFINLFASGFCNDQIEHQQTFIDYSHIIINVTEINEMK